MIAELGLGDANWVDFKLPFGEDPAAGKEAEAKDGQRDMLDIMTQVTASFGEERREKGMLWPERLKTNGVFVWADSSIAHQGEA